MPVLSGICYNGSVKSYGKLQQVITYDTKIEKARCSILFKSVKGCDVSLNEKLNQIRICSDGANMNQEVKHNG